MGRIISYDEKNGYNDGDYLLLDNGEGGTKRIRADRVGIQLDPTLTDPNKAAPANTVKPVDAVPTQGSTNAVSSGGVYSALDSNTERIESLDDDRYKPYPTDIVSGSIASFPDGADGIPLKSLVVDINPVQDLSHGDPSPTNICPISGWTEVDVEQRGKNIYDIKGWLDKLSVPYTESNGYVSFTPTSPCYSSLFELPSGTKTLSFEFSGESTATNMRFRVKYANGTIDISATTQKTGDIVGVALNWTSVGTIKVKAQIEFGSTATPYEPYTGRSITINLGQTVYGGTLDVVKGELVVDRAMIASYNGETLPSEWISDRDKYVAGATPTTGAQVIYKLSQAVTLTLSPTEVRSLLGENNVWADAGDSTVTYRADTALYINRKIAEAVSALS